MPASLVDFSYGFSSYGAAALTVTLASTPNAGDVLVVLAATGPVPIVNSETEVSTDDPDSVVFDPGINPTNDPATIVGRLILCGGTETEVTIGFVEVRANIIAGIWRVTDEAQIEPYPVGASAGVTGSTPEVPAFTATDPGFAFHLLVSADLSMPTAPAGWTVDWTTSNFFAWEFLSIAVPSAGGVAADPYGATVADDWTAVVIAVSDLGTILGPLSGTATAWGGRVAELAPAEIPPPLTPYDPGYPPEPPVSPQDPLPLEPWRTGPQYRPEAT